MRVWRLLHIDSDFDCHGDHQRDADRDRYANVHE
jgi:hypothetical protein